MKTIEKVTLNQLFENSDKASVKMLVDACARNRVNTTSDCAETFFGLLAGINVPKHFSKSDLDYILSADNADEMVLAIDEVLD